MKRILGVIHSCCRNSCALADQPVSSIVLPSRGHKYNEVRDELSVAGASSFDSSGEGGKWNPGRLRAMVEVIRAFPVLWQCIRSSRLRPFAEVLTLTVAFTQLLRRRAASENWVIIGDLSPYLIALAAACRNAGHKVIYWQYSYLDFKHLPVQGDVAIVLNEAGRDLANAGPDTPCYWRPRAAIEEIRLANLSSGSVGAMLNVHADHRALRRLSQFSEELGQRIEVRLHPNSRLVNEAWPDNLAPADPDESLEGFARRHSLLLCGNTQAQAKAVADGSAVVHAEGLDPLPFDHHGYVRDGILPGLEKGSDLDRAAIGEFFRRGDYRAALASHMGPSPTMRYPGLEQFIKDLTSNRIGKERVDGRASH